MIMTVVSVERLKSYFIRAKLGEQYYLTVAYALIQSNIAAAYREIFEGIFSHCSILGRNFDRTLCIADFEISN